MFLQGMSNLSPETTESQNEDTSEGRVRLPARGVSVAYLSILSYLLKHSPTIHVGALSEC